MASIPSLKICIQKLIGVWKHSICNKKFVIAAAALLFLVLNAVKIAFFNFHIVSDRTGGMFIYKLYMSLLLVLIFYPIILRIKSRYVFIFIYFAQALYIVVNISYYSYFHNYLNIVQSILLFKESLVTASHLAVPLYMFQLIVFIDFPFFLIVSIYYNRIYSAGTKLYLYRMATLLTSVLIIISLEVKSHASGNSLKSVLNNEFLGESRVVDRYGTLVNNLSGLFLKKNESELIRSFQYGKEISNEIEANDKPNFIIIQVESMDSNIVKLKHDNQYITPYLHSLSSESVYYPYMMSYHEGGCTSDAEFSSINSIEPLQSIPAIKLINYTYPNSMISALQKSSYKTVAFHGNDGEFFNRNVAFPKMGFDRFFDIKAMNMEHAGWGAPDKKVISFVKNYLKDARRPFLSYIITMSSHGPFTNVNLYSPNSQFNDIKDETARNYFHSMAYVDQSLNDIVPYIKSSFANTYIIIFGDHSPGIQSGAYKQASIIFDDKSIEFVPLFIITPDNRRYIETIKVASMLDLSPTVLKISGIKYKIRSDGEDLLDPGSLSNKIPFRNGLYDRSYLHKNIK
jgi:lipoteichoic acid synthase